MRDRGDAPMDENVRGLENRVREETQLQLCLGARIEGRGILIQSHFALPMSARDRKQTDGQYWRSVPSIVSSWIGIPSKRYNSGSTSTLCAQAPSNPQDLVPATHQSRSPRASHTSDWKNIVHLSGFKPTANNAARVSTLHRRNWT